MNEDENLLFICEPSSSKMKYQPNVAEFIEELTPVTTPDENKPIHLKVSNLAIDWYIYIYKVYWYIFGIFKDKIKGINQGSTNGEQNTWTTDSKIAEVSIWRDQRYGLILIT